MAALAFGASWLAPSVAKADDGEAERLFAEGRELMLQGKFEEACPKIEESQRIDPHVGTLLNLAACHERQGRVASAWVEYQQALTAARAEGQEDRARLAEERISTISSRVPWLDIRVGEGSRDAVEITLDGAVVAPVAFAKDMPVDPGEHVVRARGGAGTPFEERFVLAEGEHKTVTVALAEVIPQAEPQTVVVDPHPKLAPTAAMPQGVGSGWVFEPGVFAGYVHASRNMPVQGHAAPGSGPEYADVSDGRLAFGANVFGGYRTRRHLYLGARLLAGAGPEGATVVAVGPSVSVEATDGLRLGAWALLGDVDVRSTSAGGLGVGVELGLRLAKLSNAELFLEITPFFAAGSGTALGLPVGVSCLF